MNNLLRLVYDHLGTLIAKGEVKITNYDLSHHDIANALEDAIAPICIYERENHSDYTIFRSEDV